jgi:hypothetical protein
MTQKRKNPVPDETYQLRSKEKPPEIIEDEEWDKGKPLIVEPKETEEAETLEVIIENFTNQILDSQNDEDKVKEILRNFLIVTKGKSGKRSTVDPIKRIQEMTSIEAVRAAIKVAYAKKSKARENPESLKRYEEEIDIGKKKLNELLVQAQDPQTLLSRGEEYTRVLQAWIIQKEDDLKEGLRKVGIMTDNYNLTKHGKELMTNMTLEISDSLKIEMENMDTRIYERFKDRLIRGDKRVENIVKMQNLSEAITSGDIELKEE